MRSRLPWQQSDVFRFFFVAKHDGEYSEVISIEHMLQIIL